MRALRPSGQRVRPNVDGRLTARRRNCKIVGSQPACFPDATSGPTLFPRDETVTDTELRGSSRSPLRPRYTVGTWLCQDRHGQRIHSSPSDVPLVWAVEGRPSIAPFSLSRTEARTS